ncbi:hypothetical protein GCM10010149_85550 [Nonomuraea roseoviolacea subsp. roseoviolacea]|uniref:Uncharacterized protein n=1 Tax=Nonomuraea roseoviolacea subsp. carminata TaxID=160689 RepID=A0ABT1JQD5_9ACTN|nr:hypothetical protein [Nonomuraea roseoviolacea]MCP2343938.1 hypothetical protein [Nonomuraea roseoviolacea subsp. carminata]
MTLLGAWGRDGDRADRIAWEADEARVTPEVTAHHTGLWAMAWRARSARWLLRNRRTLVNALTA